MSFRDFGCRPDGPVEAPAFHPGEDTVVIYFDRLPFPTAGNDVATSAAARRPPLWQQSRTDGLAPGGARWARSGVRGFPSAPGAV